jgi:hypothetical protein
MNLLRSQPWLNSAPLRVGELAGLRVKNLGQILCRAGVRVNHQVRWWAPQDYVTDVNEHPRAKAPVCTSTRSASRDPPSVLH